MRARLKKELRDQSAHAALGILLGWPAAELVQFYPPLLFVWLALSWWAVREVTEEGTPLTLAKIGKALRSWRDLLGWLLGGIIMAVVAASIWGWS